MVAVKTLKENASDKERSDLVQELQVMKMLEPHPNVVRLLGCCTEKGTSMMCYLSTYLLCQCLVHCPSALVLFVCQNLLQKLTNFTLQSLVRKRHIDLYLGE